MVRYSGTFFGVLFVTFFNFLVPGRVDRVGGEELEVSVHLNRVLCPTIRMAFMENCDCLYFFVKFTSAINSIKPQSAGASLTSKHALAAN